MKPGRVCSICADSTVALRVDGLIAAGDYSLAQIAVQVGVSKYVVSRHSRHSITKLSDEAEQLPGDKLTLLFDRCENLYQALAANGDIRGASEMLKVQTRLATTLAEREEARQKSEEDKGTGDPLKDGAPSVEFCDHLLRTYDKHHREEEARQKALGMISCPCCAGAYIHPHQLRERMSAIQVAAGLVAPVPEELNVQHDSAN